MSETWSAATWTALLYGGGVIGVIAIAAFPVRITRLMRGHAWALRDQGLSRAAFVVAALAGVATAYLMAANLHHIGICLLGMYCGANRSAGWFSLTAIGVLYVAFELLAGLVLVVARHYRAHEA